MVNPRPGIGFTPIVDRFSSIHCPLLLVFGAKDEGITPGDIEAVRSRLAALGKDHEIEIYPEGGHGFFCEDRAAYDQPSAEAAWTRATAWLARKMG
jgi:carboxymethylenebutenolidase